MQASDGEKQPTRYGITPLAFIGCGWLIIPALVALLVPAILRLMQWLFE